MTEELKNNTWYPIVKIPHWMQGKKQNCIVLYKKWSAKEDKFEYHIECWDSYPCRSDIVFGGNRIIGIMIIDPEVAAIESGNYTTS